MKLRLFFASVLLVLLPALLCAQSITGSITWACFRRQWRRHSRRAEITIIQTDTNARSTVQTDASGNYTAPQLPRGSYRVEVSARGFKRFVQGGITLQIQQTARVDIQLTVGEVAESVEVTADAARLETENATLAKVVDNQHQTSTTSSSSRRASPAASTATATCATR